MPPVSLRCKECNAEYPLEARYVCEQCFGPLEVSYSIRPGTDPGELRRRIQAGPHSLWRYSRLPPGAGAVPDRSAARRLDAAPACRQVLAEQLGLRELWIKNDAANPTHSFKDRVVSIALARARELGIDTVACASTGNLANAVAAHAAAAGLESYVFVPADLEEQKLLATGIYGTNLVAVDGTYDEVNRLCTELSADHDWAFVNINLRPYYSQGSKTLAFETAEQLGFDCFPTLWCVRSPRARCSRRSRPDSRSGSTSGCSTARCRGSTAPRRRAVRRWHGAFEAGLDVCRPVKPRGDRQVAGDRQPGRWPVRARPGATHRRLDRGRDRRRDPRCD